MSKFRSKVRKLLGRERLKKIYDTQERIEKELQQFRGEQGVQNAHWGAQEERYKKYTEKELALLRREQTEHLNRLKKEQAEQLNLLKKEQAEQLKAQGKILGEVETKLSKLMQVFSELQLQSQQHQQTINMVRMDLKRNRSRQRVLFLIHNMSAWESLSEVCQLMCTDESFDVFVASLNRRFTGSKVFRDEESVHQRLVELEIDHIRLNNPSSYRDLDIIKHLAPDLIFRQSQWDADIPPAFSTASLRFAKLAFVPYEIMNFLSNVHENVDNSYFHQSCEMVFCANLVSLNALKNRLQLKDESLYLTGHPKVEKIKEAEPSWPIGPKSGDAEGEAEQRNFRVLWGAHHAIHEGWSNFGAFLQIYQGMLEWAKTAPHIDFVFSLHPALSMALEGTLDESTSASVKLFFEEWEALENTALFKDGVYGPLFTASDLLLVDGISWLLEYQTLFEKPIVFIKREDHLPFTETGLIIEKGLYATSNVEEAKQMVSGLLSGELEDHLVEQRRANYEQFLKSDGAAKKIVEIIKNY